MLAGIFLVACGAALLRQAWWMRTHEHWASAVDRVGWEVRGTRRAWSNHRISVCINRVVAPAALVILGGAATVGGGVRIVATFAGV